MVQCEAASLQFLLQVKPAASILPSLLHRDGIGIRVLKKKISIGNNLCDLELTHKVAFASPKRRKKLFL